ncbi:MAG: hypothetical protein EOP53_01645 [Sphingobacteriales bacterium]|nr:MAG: hypothetical protein EOP53_01645 [Sphingobacteriales bacterium]
MKTRNDKYDNYFSGEKDILDKFTAAGYIDAINSAHLSKTKFIETIIGVQEEERKKIGQELHDSVNSSLTIARVYLKLLNAYSQKEKEAKAQLELIIALTAKSIRSIASALVVFQDDENSLLGLIKLHVARVKKLRLFIINFHYHNSKAINQIPGFQKIVLYRIVQEQLNNIIKYSRANNVSVELKIEKLFIILVLQDDGIGFNMHESRHGIGISGIINRTRQLGGNVEIQTAPGKGCLMVISMGILKDAD